MANPEDDYLDQRSAKTYPCAAWLGLLIGRFGATRIFEIAVAASKRRWEIWFRAIHANPHADGSPGIYKAQARRLSARWNYPHNLAADIWHSSANVARECALRQPAS